MNGTAVFFFLAAIGALSGAVGVVTLRNPFYSVLALVFHLISLAVLFLLLEAQFVAAAQVIVYAGAVMVLYVFVVAYVGGGEEPVAMGGTTFKLLGPLFGAALAAELIIAVLGSALNGISTRGAHISAAFGSPAHIGQLFLTKFLFPFEIASILLLVAAVGAVVLARRRWGLEPEAEADRGLRMTRPSFTGTMAEGVGTRLPQPEPQGPQAPLDSDPEPAGAGGESRYQGGW